jgi:hypothetical protein
MLHCCFRQDADISNTDGAREERSQQHLPSNKYLYSNNNLNFLLIQFALHGYCYLNWVVAHVQSLLLINMASWPLLIVFSSHKPPLCGKDVIVLKI